MSLGGWCWWCLSRFARKKGTTSAPAQLLCLLQAGHNVSYHTLLATTWHNVSYHTLLATTWHNVSYHTLLATAGNNVSYHTLLATAGYNVGAIPPPTRSVAWLVGALWLASLAMSAHQPSPLAPIRPQWGLPRKLRFPSSKELSLPHPSS